MQKIARKAHDQLQARWPFEVRFEIPFPARLFGTGELVIEAPYLPGKWVAGITMNHESIESVQEEFARRGGFALGAERVLLHITEVRGTTSMEAGKSTYKPNREPIYLDEYIATVLWIYMKISRDHVQRVDQPKTMEVRLKHGGQHKRDASSLLEQYSFSWDEEGKEAMMYEPHHLGSA
jgi:hypothetical protein